MKAFDRTKLDRLLLDSKCVGFFEKPITLKSGRLCNYYVNVRNLVATVGIARTTARFLLDYCEDQQFAPRYFVGVPEGATALAITATHLIDYEALRDVPNVIMRATPKEHGDPKDRYFVGPIAENDRIVLVEDVTTTGESVAQCISRVQESKADIVGVIGIVDRLERREDGLSVKQYLKERFGIRYESLTDVSTLLPLAITDLHPSRKVLTSLRSYLQTYASIPIDLPK